MNWKQTFTEATLLSIAATVAGAASNHLRTESKRLAWVEKHQDSAGSRNPLRASPAPGASGGSGIPSVEDLRKIAPPIDPASLFGEISGDLAIRLHSAGALFIDARRTNDYTKGHIKGARSIAIWEHSVDEKIQNLQSSGITVDVPIVAYCSGASCEDSIRLAQKLAMAGFFSLYVYKDGFPDWERRGGPVKRGETP